MTDSPTSLKMNHMYHTQTNTGKCIKLVANRAIQQASLEQSIQDTGLLTTIMNGRQKFEAIMDLDGTPAGRMLDQEEYTTYTASLLC